MQGSQKLYIEELEARFELAVVAAAEGEADDGSCSKSCCFVGGNCGTDEGGEGGEGGGTP